MKMNLYTGCTVWLYQLRPFGYLFDHCRPFIRTLILDERYEVVNKYGDIIHFFKVCINGEIIDMPAKKVYSTAYDYAEPDLKSEYLLQRKYELKNKAIASFNQSNQ